MAISPFLVAITSASAAENGLLSETRPSESIVLSATLMPQPTGPASGSLPVVSLKSQPNNLQSAACNCEITTLLIPINTEVMLISCARVTIAYLSWSVPMPLGKPEPPNLVVVQSHSGTDYHQPMSQHSDISGSACPEYPLSQHRLSAFCDLLGTAVAQSPLSLTPRLGHR
ncbi:hypothetical protein Tco_1263959 [Tanacetum coccineum]